MKINKLVKDILLGLTILFNGILIIVSLRLLINAYAFLEGLTILLFTGFFCLNIMALVKWVKKEDD